MHSKSVTAWGENKEVACGTSSLEVRERRGNAWGETVICWGTEEVRDYMSDCDLDAHLRILLI